MVRSLANRFGYNLIRVRKPMEHPYVDVLDLMVRRFMETNRNAFFVQIGANDGKTDDPIRQFVERYHWKGVLVEPQPRAFQKLVENYRDEDQLVFENSLVTTHDGTATFYSVPEDVPGLPYNIYQAGSLRRDVIIAVLNSEKKRAPGDFPDDVETLVKESILPAMTPETLLAKYSIEKVDFLVIDAMGYDFEILKRFPFHKVKPLVVHFEHRMLPLEDQESCFKFLADLGYSFVHLWQDTIACLDTGVRISLYSPHQG